MLPPHLIGGQAAGDELLEWGGVLGRRRGVVVLDLVVVPDRQPRAHRPRRLELGIGQIQGVALAVLVNGERLAATERAHRPTEVAVLVDEVTEPDDEIRCPGGEVAVGGVVAGLEALARRAGDAQVRRIGAGRRDPPDRTRRFARPEPEPRRGGDVDDDVHAVGVLGPGHDLTRSNDRRERFVGRQLPHDGHVIAPEW